MAVPPQPQPPGRRYCPTCGAPLSPEARFCMACGAAVGETGFGAALGMRHPIPDAEYMGFWIRVATLLVDSIIWWVVTFIVLGGVFAYVGLSAWTSLSGFYVVLAAYVFVVLVHFAYHVFLVGVKGQTLGKMALGIQVVNSQGNVPGIGRALLREVVGKAISGLPLYLGYFWAGWDPHKRAWHDHISGTFVVRKQRQQSGPS